MKTNIPHARGALAGLGRGAVFCSLVAAVATIHAATPRTDLQPPQKRQATVDAAQRLVHRKMPPAIPADMVSPFNPTDFDRPDASETAASQRPGAAGPRPANVGQAAGPAVRAVTPAAPAGDREVLETISAQLVPSGTMLAPGGKPLLIIGKNQLSVGTRFTVTYKEQEYELELVAIDRTTFTLRYRNEETIRPIKPVR
jgi:hypothetical protein